MTWKQEAREFKQRQYGGYCAMCKKLNITPVPYHSFDGAEYHRVFKLKEK